MSHKSLSLSLVFFLILVSFLSACSGDEENNQESLRGNSDGTCSESWRSFSIIQVGDTITPRLTWHAIDVYSNVLNYDYGVVFQLPGGKTAKVLDGPYCRNVNIYYLVEYEGERGWVVEVPSDGYHYTFPVNTSSTAHRDGLVLPIISVGIRAEVSWDPSANNALKDAPGKESTQTRSMPPGTRFTIIDGPRFASDLRYWKVRLDDGTEGWTADGDGRDYWLWPVEQELRFAGSEQPFSEHFVFIPSPVRLGSISVFSERDLNSQPLGSLIPLNYYRFINGVDEWTQVRDVNGQTGWTNSNLLVVGTQRKGEVDVEWVVKHSIATVYPQRQLPAKYNRANREFLDGVGGNTAVVIGNTYFVYELLKNGIEPISVVCTTIDNYEEFTNDERTGKVSFLCLGLDAVNGLIELKGGSPIGLYIVVSQFVLKNLDAFVRYTDERWMDRANQTFGNCPLTQLIYGEGC